MTKAILKDVEEKLKHTLEATRHELSTLRAGKASLAILEPVRVDSYGNKVPLNQVATLGVPEPRLITVQPWDPQTDCRHRAGHHGGQPGAKPRQRRPHDPNPHTDPHRGPAQGPVQEGPRNRREKGKVAVRHIRHEGRAAL